jgi:hypothetical protein
MNAKRFGKILIDDVNVVQDFDVFTNEPDWTYQDVFFPFRCKAFDDFSRVGSQPGNVGDGSRLIGKLLRL